MTGGGRSGGAGSNGFEIESVVSGWLTLAASENDRKVSMSMAVSRTIEHLELTLSSLE